MRIPVVLLAALVVALAAPAKAAPSAYALYEACSAYHVPATKREREDWIRLKQCEAGIEQAVRELEWPAEIPGAPAAIDAEVAKRSEANLPERFRNAASFEALFNQDSWLNGSDRETMERRRAAYCPGAVGPTGIPIIPTERLIQIVLRHWDANPPNAVFGRFASGTDAVGTALASEYPRCAIRGLR